MQFQRKPYKIIEDYIKCYDVAVNLTKEQEKYPDDVCLTCIGELSNAKNVSIISLEGQREGYSIMFYIISKEQSPESITYIFAHKFKLNQSIW